MARRRSTARTAAVLAYPKAVAPRPLLCVFSLISASCGARPEPAPVEPAWPPPTDCAAPLSSAVARVSELQAQGRLDDALRSAEAITTSCAAVTLQLAEARLSILEALGEVDGLLKVAAEIIDHPDASAASRRRAERIVQSKPHSLADQLLAEQAITRGDALRGAARRAAYDTALRAYERLSGEQPQVVALRATDRLQFLNQDTVIATTRAEPSGKFHTVVVPLAPASGSAVRQGRATRLLRGADGDQHISVADGRTVVTSAEGVGYVYTAPAFNGRRLPPAERHDALSGARIVIASTDAVEVRDAGDPASTLYRASVSLDPGALTAAKKSADGRFWAACLFKRSGVVAVDAQANALAVNRSTALGCGFDSERSMMAVVHTSSPSRRYSLELIQLTTSSRRRVQLGAVAADDDVRLTVNAASQHAIVTGGSRQTIVDIDTGKILRPPLPKRRVGPAHLRGVSVGSAGGSAASVRALRSLAIAPRRVIKPVFATPQSWTANGVMSFDGKTVAAFTSDADDTNVRLVIADARDLSVRHRIPIAFGVNWLTASFIDNRLLIVQSYPNRDVYDIGTGKRVARLTDADVHVEFGRYLRSLGELWDTDRNVTGKRRLDLGLESGGGWTTHGSGIRTVAHSTLRVEFDDHGRVTLPDAKQAPPWLYCRFGEWLTPWEICRNRVRR